MKIAQDQFEFEKGEFDFLRDCDVDTERSEIANNYRTLIDLKKALLEDRYYTRRDSVSSSGLSSIIKIAYVKDNRVFYIHQKFLLQLACCNENGKISSYGADELYFAQYKLFQKLCPNHDYRISMKQYNTLP